MRKAADSRPRHTPAPGPRAPVRVVHKVGNDKHGMPFSSPSPPGPRRPVLTAALSLSPTPSSLPAVPPPQRPLGVNRGTAGLGRARLVAMLQKATV